MKHFKAALVMTICVFLLAPSVLCGMSSAEEPREIFHPQVREVRGAVMVRGTKDGIWEEATEGMLLLSGDVLRTDLDGFARIEFQSGVIDIYETTVLVIPSIDITERKKDIREIFVEEGKTFFHINPTGVEGGFQFRTKNVQGGVKGTMFTVSYLDDGTAVNVYRGEVSVSDRAGTPETVTNLGKGQALRVTDKSGFSNIKRFDPDPAIDDYSYNLLPGLDEKGLPADYHASPRNRGVRNKGEGRSDSNNGSADDGDSSKGTEDDKRDVD